MTYGAVAYASGGYASLEAAAVAAGSEPETALFIETTAGVWYDASAALISGTVTRGKQNELDQYQAGVIELLLDNDDRKYDPTYAASPLNGHIVPMKRVRLENTYAGVTYPMFLGYADRWTQNREGPHRGTTSLQATDGFKVLERAILPVSVWAREVQVDGPTHWYRFDEPSGAAIAFNAGSLGPSRDGTYQEPASLGQAGLIINDSGTALKPNVPVVSGTHAVILAPAGGTGLSQGGGSIEFWLKPTAFSVVDFMFEQTGTDGLSSRSCSTNSNKLFFDVQNSVGTIFTISTSALTMGLTYHVVYRESADGTMKVFVNGVDDTTVQAGGVVIGTVNLGVFEMAETSAGGDYVIDEFVIYNTPLSNARIAAHNSAGRAPWSGDLPGARINRVLDAVDWPAAQREIDAGSTTLQSAELDMSALEHVQKVSDTEFGDLYVTAAGVVRFEGRAGGIDQPVLFTFSDAPGGDLPITFSNPEISDENIRNDVTVSRLDGTAQNVQDATSIAAYQTSSYVRDGLYHDSDTHSRFLAQFILAGYKDPVERVSQMQINPYRDPTILWPAILALELTDRIVLNETPQNVSPEVSRTVVVEGISHTFAAKAWSASFNVSENTAATQAYWKLGVAGFSELGETTRLFF